MRRFLPTASEGRGRLVGAALGLAGAVYVTVHVLRYLQLS